MQRIIFRYEVNFSAGGCWEKEGGEKEIPMVKYPNAVNLFSPRDETLHLLEALP